MANHRSSEGTFKVGANVVAEIREMEVDEVATPIEDSEIGDEWDTKQAGTVSWTFRASVWWDETDTNGQEAMAINQVLTVGYYPEGDGSGAQYRTGTCIITGRTVRSRRGSIVEADIRGDGSGELSKSTVA